MICPADSKTKRIGLIDIGSNTIRLVVFEFSKRHGLKELQNIKTPARLYRYLNEDKEMSDEGISVLIETLKSFGKVSDKFDVEELYPVATAAVRQSTNLDQIKSRVFEETGVTLTIVSESEEAFYGFYAVINTIEIEDGVTVDIGGGSTEVTYFEDKELKHSHSFPFGVVTLKEMFFKDKPHNDKEAINKTIEYVKEQFSSLRWLEKRYVPIIAIGGSARNIARIHQSKNEYPIAGVHGYEMNIDDLDDVFNTLVDTDESDLEDIDGLSKDRTDIIVQSNIVFKALYDEVGAKMFKFSRKGLREGVVMRILEKDFEMPFDRYKVFKNSLLELASDYNIDLDNANQRIMIAETMYYELRKQGYFEHSKSQKKFIRHAAFLYYLGAYIDADSSSQHTYYILSNSNINGINHKDRVKLALLASFKNKSLLKFYMDEIPWFSNDEQDRIQAFGGLLKFCHALDISNTSIVKGLYISNVDDDTIDLTIEYQGDAIAEMYQADRQKKHIEKITKKNLNLIFTKI